MRRKFFSQDLRGKPKCFAPSHAQAHTTDSSAPASRVDVIITSRITPDWRHVLTHTHTHAVSIRIELFSCYGRCRLLHVPENFLTCWIVQLQLRPRGNVIFCTSSRAGRQSCSHLLLVMKTHSENEKGIARYVRAISEALLGSLADWSSPSSAFWKCRLFASTVE